MSIYAESGASGHRTAMKTISTRLRIICTLAAAGLTFWLVVERQARFKLEQEDRAWRQQLSRMEEIIAENQRLSNLVAQANGSQSSPATRTQAPSPTDERAKDLMRLRGEVEVLRQQSKEIESLRADTRQLSAARENGLQTQNAGQPAIGNNGITSNATRLEIVKAEYWTDNTNMDVAAELRERIRGDGLKAVASNNLKGDPEFGQVKHLTVVYRSGGVTMTNEFREGDLVILPKE
jgi:hypothetical protein